MTRHVAAAVLTFALVAAGGAAMGAPEPQKAAKPKPQEAVAAAPPQPQDAPAAAPKAPPAAAPAAEALKAKVASVTGAAQRLVVGAAGQRTWVALKAGDMLDELTVIRTGLRSRVVLQLADRGEVVVNSATKIGIGQFRKEGATVTTRLGLKYGTIRARVERAHGPNDFQVATPTITASVGGSMSDLGYAADTGFQIASLEDVWKALAAYLEQQVREGEMTDEELQRWIVLLIIYRDTAMADWLGLTPEEILTQLYNGRGRGFIGLPGTRGTGFKPLRRQSLTPLEEPNGENGYEPYFDYQPPPYSGLSGYLGPSEYVRYMQQQQQQ
jgi:hypothetical protein